MYIISFAFSNSRLYVSLVSIWQANVPMPEVKMLKLDAFSIHSSYALKRLLAAITVKMPWYLEYREIIQFHKQSTAGKGAWWNDPWSIGLSIKGHKSSCLYLRSDSPSCRSWNCFYDNGPATSAWQLSQRLAITMILKLFELHEWNEPWNSNQRDVAIIM